MSVTVPKTDCANEHKRDPTMGSRRLLRLEIWSILILALQATYVANSAANATQSISAYFGPICIHVIDLSEDLTLNTRNDLAQRVASAVRIKIEAAERDSRRKVSTWPECVEVDQPGFDRQLSLTLSVKKQKIMLEGRPFNVIVAGGVSRDGLIQDRDAQPVLIVQQQSVSEDSIVDALVEFVDRKVVASLRRR